MSPAALQRQAALAGAALLAALGVVALVRSTNEAPGATIGSATVSSPRWESAVVGVLGGDRLGTTTACGVALTPETLGVAHPVLPCGVELVLASGGREVRAEVVERGTAGSETRFDVTPALAEELGIDGRRRIRWRFAG
ncbi:MAG TPA: hypothetical protein VFW80_13225 [Gaiellaceae bacterium]|nr:hypothetical protein [Gaiellaceae bacterium]